MGGTARTCNESGGRGAFIDRKTVAANPAPDRTIERRRFNHEGNHAPGVMAINGSDSHDTIKGLGSCEPGPGIL